MTVLTGYVWTADYRRKNLLSQTKTDTCGRCTVPQKEKELRSGCYSPEQTTCPFDFYLTRRMDLLFSISEME